MRCLLIISLAVLSLASAIPIVSRSDNAAIVEFFKYAETKRDEQVYFIMDRALQFFENLIADVPTELQGQQIAVLKDHLNRAKAVQLSGSSHQKIDFLFQGDIFRDMKDEPEAENEIFHKILISLERKLPRSYWTDELLHNEFTKAAAILKTKMSPATLESECKLFEAMQNYIDCDDSLKRRDQLMERFLTFKNKYSTVSN